MKIENCRLCGSPINENTDKTICGYGKCVKCCQQECQHRTHYNYKVIPQALVKEAQRRFNRK